MVYWPSFNEFIQKNIKEIYPFDRVYTLSAREVLGHCTLSEKGIFLWWKWSSLRTGNNDFLEMILHMLESSISLFWTHCRQEMLEEFVCIYLGYFFIRSFIP